MADNINTYMGNAALAQGTAGGEGGYVVNPDYAPTLGAVDKIMMYDFYEKRDDWTRQNLIADKMSEEAADMAKFPMQDWLIEGDRDAVHGLVGNFQKVFSEHPDAVRMRYDPKTGKPLNADEFNKLQTAQQDAMNGIYRANARTDKFKTLQAQVEKITDPTRRAKAEAYVKQVAQLPLDKDFTLYPDLDVFNRGAITGIKVTPEADTPLGGYLKTTGVTMTDIGNSLPVYQSQMMSPGGEQLKDAIESDIKTFQGQVNEVIAKHPEYTDRQIIDELRKTQAGQSLASLYDTYYNVKAFNEGIVDKFNKERPDLPPTQIGKAPEIDLRNLNSSHILGFYITDDASKDISVKLKERTMAKEELGLGWYRAQHPAGKTDDEAYGHTKLEMMKGVATAWQQPGVTKDDHPPDLFLSGVPGGAYGLLPGQSQSVVAGMDKRGSLAGRDFYKLPVSESIQNIFRKPIPGTLKSTIIGTDKDTNEPIKTYEQQSYNIVGAWTVPDKDFNINNNNYAILYEDPQTHKQFTEVWNNVDLNRGAAHLFDNGTAAGTKATQQIEVGYQGIKKQQGWGDNPDFSTMFGQTTAPGQPPPQPAYKPKSTDVYTDAKGQKLKYTDLKDMGYSDADIAQAIEFGNIKL